METLVVLAQHGLFLPEYSCSVAKATPRSYLIRRACIADIDRLAVIETTCWKELAISKTHISKRISNFPSGQWVCEVKNEIVGVMYTQQLKFAADLLNSNVTFTSQENLHSDNDFSSIQLLGVAVLPEYAHLQIGAALRDFVLQLCQATPTLLSVVAMTRCSSYSNTKEDYLQKVKSGDDPTLQFHISGRAVVVQAVEGFRADDDLNFGHAVMIQYDLKNDTHLSKRSIISSSRTSAVTDGVAEVLTMAELKALIIAVAETPAAVRISKLSTEDLFDVPFMDLGLHSLAMVELRARLSKQLEQSGRSAINILSPTVLFDHPTSRQLLALINGAIAPSYDVPPNMSSSEDSETMFAICATSCRFPGGVQSMEGFHTALMHNLDAVNALPKDWQWDSKTQYASLLSEDMSETFDPSFFKLSAAEAERMDPHQRILLEVSHEALTSAGVLSTAMGSVAQHVGVYVGLCNNEWKMSQNEDEPLGPYDTTGSAQSAAANRVSFLLGLTGPSLVVDTACSSSLAAVHTAINALRCGDCDVALVAAADLLVSSHSLKIREEANMLSPDGKNRSFDDRANGYVRGEGAGAIVIKTLTRARVDHATAIAAGDSNPPPILAVIRGSAMNQDGRSASFTAPNGSAQRALLRNALRNAKVQPEQVSFIEAHGTGTPLGDPIEWGALRDVFLSCDSSKAPSSGCPPLIIGAVKTNIGHLEGAAGMAGLIKTVACLQSRQIPPNLHFNQLNKQMQIDPSHRRAIFPVDSVQLLPSSSIEREAEVIAAVSSFGSGGTNVSVVLESFTAHSDASTVSSSIIEDMPAVLNKKLGFVFTGQGLVYSHMGKELFEAEPSFRETILRCSDAVSLSPSLVDVMYCTTAAITELVESSVYSQLALFALEVALANVWKTRGIVPDTVTGHSLGEYAAAVVAGVFNPETAIRILHLRLQSLVKFGREVSADGAMLAIRCSETEAMQALAVVTQRVPHVQVVLAAVNGPNAVVLSGNRLALNEIIREMNNPVSKFLTVDYAYHSPLLYTAAQDFKMNFMDAVGKGEIEFSATNSSISLVSCKTGKLMSLDILKTPEYWVDQMLSPVRFLDCAETLQSDAGCCSVLVEIGPSNILTKLMKSFVNASECSVFSSLLKGVDSLDQLDAAVASTQRCLLSTRGRLGGRLSSFYRPIALPWRKRGTTVHCDWTANANTIQPTRHSTMHNLVRSAILNVLPAEAVEYLTAGTSFLSLGLDSLASQAVRNVLASKLNLPNLSNTIVLKHPTVEDLVEHLENLLNNNTETAEAVLSRAPKSPQDLDDAVFDVNDLLEDGVEAQFPATCMQQAMLFHHISDPDAKSFIETFHWEMHGALQLDRFYRAWLTVLSASPAMRSVFDPYAVPVPVQRVLYAESMESLNCAMEKSPWFKTASVAHLGLSGAELDKAIETELRIQRHWQFDLAVAPLLKLTVVCIDAQHSALLLTMHHAIIDGFSIIRLLEAVSACYNCNPAACISEALPSGITINYDEFASYETNVAQKDPAAQRYWRNVVQSWQSGPQAMINMPVLRVNLADEDVVRVHQTFDTKVLHNLQTAARRANVTLAAFFHAAWGAVYAKLTCTEDILYGNTSSGRTANLSSINSIIGPVINTFPMRYPVESGQSITDYLHIVQRTLLNSLEFENFPLAEIQKFAAGSGSLFSVIFDFQTATWDHEFIREGEGSDSGISLRNSRLIDRIGCPISVRVIVDGDQLQLHATSECKEYGQSVLENILHSLTTVATFIAEVVTGGNPLQRDARARVFDLMDLVPLCRHRKLSIVTFTEEEGKELENVHLPTVASSSHSLAEMEHIIPNLSQVSAPTQFTIMLESAEMQRFTQCCATFDCEHAAVMLSLYLWSLRKYSSAAVVGVNYTSALASNATKHVSLDTMSNTSLHVLLAVVSSTLAVDQSTFPTNTLSPLVFTCASNPILPAGTTVAMIMHENTQDITLTLKFPTDSIPIEVMDGIYNAFKVLLNRLITTTITVNHTELISDIIPLPGPVASIRPDCVISDRLMHEDVFANAAMQSDIRSLPAIVQYNTAGEKACLSFEELTHISNNVAYELVENVRKAKVKNPTGTCVIAVVMEKGWEQVAAVLAVHRLQCAYLPMDARLWPEQRIRQVLELSEAVAVITQPALLESPTLKWMCGLSIPVTTVSVHCKDRVSQCLDLAALDQLPTVSADALAYLIYTSGSTGIPKGVCCHHRGAMNTIDDLNSLFAVTARDRVLALSSLSFDLSVYDIFGLLSAGGTVVIPDPKTVSPPDPSEWFDLVETEQVTIWNTVPAFMELLVSHAEYMGLRLPACLRLVYMSGDWIPVTLPSRIRAVSDCPDIRIISMGGATEASIWSNMFELQNIPGGGVPEGWSSIPYGKPMRNQRMYILNERMENCDMWVTGAIYIGGVGVAQGYYKNPKRTAYQFVKHPVTGESLFRTGDLGRVRPGGLIEILGREDSQVKVNGFRIELGEIERVLLEHEDVVSAALAVHSNILCAYLVMKNATEDSKIDTSAMKALCKTRLAEYMVPQHFVCIDEIPLSANGKVQRDKLPKIQNEATSCSDMGGEGQVFSEKEQIIAEIWGNLLGINAAAIPIDANFFSLGGDSLRSVQVVAQAKKMGLLLSVPQIFSNPTLRTLADVANSFRELGPDVLGTSTDTVNAKPIFTVEQRDDLMFEEYPLIGVNQAHFVGLHTSSYARGGMTPQIYFEWEIGQSGSSLNQESSFDGQISVSKFELAIDRFVARHATFRSVVRKNGTMKVLETVPHFVVQHVHPWNGDSTSALECASAYRTYMMDHGPTVHDWPLFEVRITHTSATSSLVHINVSLFLMDAMSDLILRQELSALYRAPDSAIVDDILPAPTRLQFKDYCSALTSKLHQSEEYIRAREYWLSRIDELGSGPELPLLPAQLEGSDSGLLTGKFVNFHRWLTVLEWKRARKNCAFHSVTMPAVLLAAYSLVLYRWGSRDKFLINILQCLRHQVHEDVNKMVGNCSSTILCDINLRKPENGELTFRIAVQRVAQELSQNLEHASMSGVEVMQELNRIRGKTFNAVAPFIFTTPIGVEKGNKQVMSRDWMFQEKFFSERVPHTACVNAIKADPNGTACASLDVVDGVFPKEVMEGMHSTYLGILSIICAEDPNAWHQPISSSLALPDPVDSIRPDCAISHRLMHHDFLTNSDQKEVTHLPAVVQYSEGGTKQDVSYATLKGIAEETAARLVDGIMMFKMKNPTGTCVIAVVMEKGWEQVAAVLAVHRLQCAYLPMDARLWPEQRIRQVLELSEAVAVITQPRLLESDGLRWLKSIKIPVATVEYEQCSKSDLTFLLKLDQLPTVSADALAYLIYTSGSTGIPKGVCCHHRGAMNTIDDLNSLFAVTARDRVLALSSLSFDLSVYDIFGLLSAGGTVVIPDPNTISPPDPSKWFDIVISEGITIWNTVPAFMELLVSHAEYMGLRLPACLRLVYMSGDWIPVTLPSRIRAVSDCPDIRIISMGGATEASIWSNMFELQNIPGGGVPEGWSSIPYGKPMRNQRMYILNERMENCDMWVTGAIYIGGVGVAQGYYKNPERTAYQFVKHPVTGESLFRTGDLGRVRPGGLIEILGREDSQVKVNGFRIELGEIERVLLEHEDVVSAALAVHKNTLCAYLVMNSSFDKVADESSKDTVFEVLQDACKVRLAEYMVPKHFMYIEEIPLSANGKVQRELLPSPHLLLNEARKRSNSITERLHQPSNDLEAKIRAIFANILNCMEDTICCKRSTFFDLGGNSLTSIQLIFALRDQFGITIGVQDLFRAPTVMGICALIDKDYHIPAAGTTTAPSRRASKTQTMASIEQLHLTEGQPGEMPIIMFNPAGASGLCYLPLIQQIDKKYPVYVMDDGVMTSGRPFIFKSIDQVAAACLPFVKTIAAKSNKKSAVQITLAGWSYGGVVASAVAKLLSGDAQSGIEVKTLILFDSPLRAPKRTGEASVGQVHSTAPIIDTGATDSSNGDDLQARTQAHFRACTDLLKDFYQQYNNNSEMATTSSTPLLQCAVCDIRPRQTDYDCGLEAAADLTMGPAYRVMVPGTHWTMLFQDNVVCVGKVLKQLL